MGSRIKNAKRNIIGGLIRRMVMMLFPFVVRSVLIYKLGALYLGLNSLFSSILQVLSLAELGFGEAMVFAMYEPIAEEDDITIRALLGLYRKIYSVIGAVILSVGLVILPFLPRFISGEIPEQVNIYVLFLVYLINTCISYFLYAYKTSVLIADQRSDIFSNISTICSIIMYSLQILALLVTHNYYIYCILIPITTILNNLIIQIVTKKLYPQYYCDGQLDNSITKEIKKRVFGVFVFKVCSVFRNSFDSIVISAFLGLVVLGKYQNYFYIINSVMGIMIVLTSSITAGVGNSIIIDSKDKNYDDFIKFQFMYMGIACVCTSCFYCLLQPFIKMWVGSEMMFSELEMTFFCVYFFCNEIGSICYVYRQAAGLWWQDRFRPMVEAVVNLILNIVLVKTIGVTGVLLSTIICLVIINTFWGSRVLFTNYFVEKHQIEYLLKIVWYSVISFLGAFLSKNICNLAHFSGILELVWNSIVAVTVSGLCFIVGGIILPEHKSAALFVKKIIRGK